MNDRALVPVSLPMALVKHLDELVEKGEFASRSEALRYGARLVVLLSKRVHKRAEEYAYEEIKEGLVRGMAGVS